MQRKVAFLQESPNLMVAKRHVDSTARGSSRASLHTRPAGGWAAAGVCKGTDANQTKASGWGARKHPPAFLPLALQVT